MWLKLEGRNRQKDDRIILETIFFRLNLKEFKVLEAVIQSFIDSSKIEVITFDVRDDIGYGYESHYDVIVVQNDKYNLKIYYHNIGKSFTSLERLILKLAFREETDPKVILLEILHLAEGLVVEKRQQAEWCITILRKR